GQRQDGGTGPQGREVALGVPLQARVRRRPDAAAPARAQARVPQPVPGRVRRGQPRHPRHTGTARRAAADQQHQEAAESPRARRGRQGADRPRAQVQRQGRGEDRGGGRRDGATLVNDSLKNIFTVSDLRNRVLFTLGMLAVYRIGHHITVPGVNLAALDELARQMQNNMFGLYDMFSGGNLSKVTIFALGIMPYISASIILQLLTVVWPYLEKLSKEGELGRRKITQYTRYGTILLSVVQSLGIAIFLERQTNIAGGLPLVYNPGLAFRLMTVLTLTTGSCFIMWLGEQITERGIGNGMSLIIYAGIVVGLPRAVLQTIDQMRTGQIGLIQILFLLVFMTLVIAAIVFVERGHRRVTVQYAKRVVGRRMYGGSSTHIPLKVNTGGVIPVIFASSILAFP